MAADYFSGTILRDTRWIGDIYINGDVIIPQGVILSIESGSRVFFKPHTDVQKSGKDKERAELIVNGILLAKASSEQSRIIFTSEREDPKMNDWYGIVIKNFYNNSVLENCIIEFAYKGITCYGSAPQISDCEIRFHHHSGISCEVRASPVIYECVIVGNGFAGINCELASSPLISKSTITQNKFGVVSFSRSQPDLGHITAGERQSEGENRIYNNFDFDVYNHSVNNIYAQNNFWNTTEPNEIRFSIYDNLKNPAYGRVIFEPIFLRRDVQRLRIPSIASAERTPDATGQPVVPKPDTTMSSSIVSDDTLPDVSELSAKESQLSEQRYDTSVQETMIQAKPETVFVYKDSEQVENAKNNQIISDTPILEAFLDSGERQYLHRVKPSYPGIYRKTEQEGDVIIEVVVGVEGKVEDYRVLRSDGELFTESALQALRKYRYKPGTFNGEPVEFKIVERFRFRRSRTD